MYLVHKSYSYLVGSLMATVAGTSEDGLAGGHVPALALGELDGQLVHVDACHGRAVSTTSTCSAPRL